MTTVEEVAADKAARVDATHAAAQKMKTLWPTRIQPWPKCRGTETERVRALASRTVPAPAPDQRLRSAAAHLIADLEEVTDVGEVWGIRLVRALRLWLGLSRDPTPSPSLRRTSPKRSTHG